MLVEKWILYPHIRVFPRVPRNLISKMINMSGDVIINLNRFTYNVVSSY